METLKNKPWNFCETPEEKCTMNYCDENGCQNRKRNLVKPKKSKAATFILGQIDKAIEKSNLEQQIEKPETLYRKVAVSERKPKEGWVLTASGGWLFVDNKFKCPHSGEEQASSSFTHWLEEIPDPTAQLQADKAELLEALEKATDLLEAGFPNISVVKESKSLIQKHKQ